MKHKKNMDNEGMNSAVDICNPVAVTGEPHYRVTHLLANLGLVDFDLRSSPDQLGQ